MFFLNYVRRDTSKLRYLLTLFTVNVVLLSYNFQNFFLIQHTELNKLKTKPFLALAIRLYPKVFIAKLSEIVGEGSYITDVII